MITGAQRVSPFPYIRLSGRALADIAPRPIVGAKPARRALDRVPVDLPATTPPEPPIRAALIDETTTAGTTASRWAHRAAADRLRATGSVSHYTSITPPYPS